MEDDNKLILERKKKFDRLKENYNPYPNSFKKTSSSQSIIEKYGNINKEMRRMEATLQVVLTSRNCGS